jgi:hypothetical protein
MRSTRVTLPEPWVSNLVCASDGRTLFGLTAKGDLESVPVPGDPDEGPPRVERLRAGSSGVVLAAGWLEGRLATIALVDDELELSHGESGVDGAPSEAARIPVAGTELRLAGRGGRLDPYARWWQEINPVEELMTAISLVRDDDDRLFSVAMWRENRALRVNVQLAAEEVVALASFDEAGATVIVGRAPSPPPVAGLKRLWARPAPVRQGVFRLDWRAGLGLCRSIDAPEAPARAFVGGSGGSLMGGCGLFAFAVAAPTWTIVDDGSAVDVEVPVDEEVVGVAAAPSAAEPSSLIVRGFANRTLALRRPGGTRPLVETSESITAVAVIPRAPLVAYLAGSELCFVRLA